MLEPQLPEFHHHLAASWNAMGEGAPMLAALAGLCARAVLNGGESLGDLSAEEEGILYAARERGVIEVRGVHTGFEAPMRFLAVYIDLSDQERLELRNRFRPDITIRFFDAFCQLCRRGLILHHLHHDFSLTTRGFEIGRSFNPTAMQVFDALYEE